MSKNKNNSLLAYDAQFFAKGFSGVIGADEAGRGTLAGPVIAGSVWISRQFFETYQNAEFITLFQDSKLLSEEQREEAFRQLQELAQTGCIAFSYGEASVDEIETHNILRATTLAFQRALEKLQTERSLSLKKKDALFDFHTDEETIPILIDGLPLKQFPYEHSGLVKGDRTSFCIAAASIVAKVTRDHYMQELAQAYPHYGFNEHKGYGTEKHREAIQKWGPCPLHRLSFLKKLYSAKPQNSQLSFL